MTGVKIGVRAACAVAWFLVTTHAAVGQTVYWINAGSGDFSQVDLEAGDSCESLLGSLASPHDLAVDLAGGKVYWTQGLPFVQPRIRRANLDGTDVEDLVTDGLGAPSGIALHHSDKKIYWTDGALAKVMRADFDGGNVEMVVENLSTPWGIAIDRLGEHVYWTDIGWNTVMRAPLSGAYMQVLALDQEQPFDIAIDHGDDRVYWTSAGSGDIRRARLDGEEIETVMDTAGDPLGLAFDRAAGKLYWTDGDANLVRRVNIDGTEIEDVCDSGVASPQGIAVVRRQLFVDRDATGADRDGSSWCRALPSLSRALNAVNPGTIIRVADGLYVPDVGNLTEPRKATFDLAPDVVLEGGYAGCGANDPDERDIELYETILSGDLNSDDTPDFGDRTDNCYHVVTNGDPNVTETTVMDGFTVQSGYANGTLAEKTDQGSGLHNHNGFPDFTGKPTLRNCLFRDNFATNHGTVNDHGGMTIINCELRDNQADMWAGGLFIQRDLDTTVIDTRFINNSTGGTLGGGGGSANAGRATFTNCLWSGNVSITSGGGAYNHSGATPTFTNCRFENNQSKQGGGMYNTDASKPELIDCTFTNNTADDVAAGAYFIEGSDGELTRCTFEGNTSGSNGGGVVCVNSSPTFRHCRFIANTAGGNGGGMENIFDSAPLVLDTVFINNSAKDGGGLHCAFDSDPMLISCKFHGNDATIGGGAASLLDSDPTFFNAVFSGNSAIVKGGAIHNVDSDTEFINCTMWANHAPTAGGINVAFSLPTIRNCAILGNTNESGTGEAAQIEYTGPVAPEISYSNIQGLNRFKGDNNIGDEPDWPQAAGEDGEVGTEDDAPRPGIGSPCIDAGDNEAVPEWLETDVAMGRRIARGRFPFDPSDTVSPNVDIGAFELILGDLNGDGTSDLSDYTLWFACEGESSDDCDSADLDGDGDLDVLDWAGMQWAISTAP